jgi:hypothetical protein
VPNASITLFEHGPGPWTQSIWEGIGTTKTDPSGRFRIEAPAARYRMQVLAGESEEWRAVELPCITPIEFDLSQDTRLVVGVHDAAGVSCPGLPMLLQCVDGRWLSSRTDDNGSACFSHLPAGTQRLLLAETKAGDPQHGDHVLEVELLAGRERRVEMTVSGAARCARLSVEGLAALADWHACVPNGSERRFGSTVDVDGRIPIDIRDCPLLAIESPDHRQWEFLLPRDAPDGYAVHIVPDGPGYEGTLCSLVDGKALTNLRVIAVPLDRAGQAGTIGIGVTDAQGRFRLTGLEEKQYGLWFESPSGSQEYARTRVHPREGPASPATQLALAIPRQIGQGFEGLDSITIRGVVRRASDRSLPQRGAIWSELEKPGYLLRANVPFAVRADGSYEVHAPAALRYTASFGSTGTGSEPEVTWSATSTGDIEVHDFELP